MTTIQLPPVDVEPEPRSDVAAEELHEPSAPERPRKIRGLSFEHSATMIGSVVASLALDWLVYERLLAFSGTFGFLVCWYALFLAFVGVLTSLSYPRPIVVDRLIAGVVAGGAGIVGIAVATTVIFTFVKGWPALQHWNFFVHDMAGVRPNDPLTKGGIGHAALGSAIQVGIAVLISLPLGIATAVYMTEVGGRLSQIVRTVVEAMTALPDILAGLFVYVLLIIQFHMAKDGFAVAIALAVTMIPIIARSADVTLRVVPGGLREAGLALGATQWQVVRRVVLPTARSGLSTALILGVARAAGETAPLLIVSGASTFYNRNPFNNNMNSLPLFIYSAVKSPNPLFVQRGYGAAAVLLVLVLVLFVITRIMARDKVRSR